MHGPCPCTAAVTLLIIFAGLAVAQGCSACSILPFLQRSWHRRGRGQAQPFLAHNGNVPCKESCETVKLLQCQPRQHYPPCLPCAFLKPKPASGARYCIAILEHFYTGCTCQCLDRSACKTEAVACLCKIALMLCRILLISASMLSKATCYHGMCAD